MCKCYGGWRAGCEQSGQRGDGSKCWPRLDDAAWKGGSVGVRLANPVTGRKGATLLRLSRRNPFMGRLHFHVGGEKFKSGLKDLCEQQGMLEGTVCHPFLPWPRCGNCPYGSCCFIKALERHVVLLLYPSTIFLSFNMAILILFTLPV